MTWFVTKRAKYGYGGWKPLPLLAGIFLLVLPGLSFAQLPTATPSSPAKPADSPCDPQYYESMKQRAWMEAQREITQNQNLIFKPDSVMEYTCFDKFMNVLAAQATNMFSETTRWGGILSNKSMDNALQNLVGEALGNYIDLNFKHKYLGHRSSGDSSINPVSGGTYSCGEMLKVWGEAKCMDFIANETNDGFYPFTDYRDDPDKRFLPAPCDNPQIKNRWTESIDLATVNAKTPWEEDDVRTYFEFLDPSNCSSTGPLPQIDTGLTVIPAKGDIYDEKICIPAGCHYVDKKGCQP